MAMFTITIKLDDATATRFDRLLDLIEGKQQTEVSALAARLIRSTERLKNAQNSPQGEN